MSSVMHYFMYSLLTYSSLTFNIIQAVENALKPMALLSVTCPSSCSPLSGSKVLPFTYSVNNSHNPHMQ